MTNEKIRETIKECTRFIDRAETLLKVQREFETRCENPRERGAVKRASMDLSRALTELRRS